MKKYMYLGFALILLFLCMSIVTFTPVKAHNEDEPFITDLIAGGGNEKSEIDVGDVMVWNDEENLYVKYITTSGWCLVETHLEINISLDGIPQTKNFNPILGHFTYFREYELEVCITEDVYVIPIEWEYGTDLYIAAHAVVVQEKTKCLTSEPGVNVYGPITVYAPLSDASWGTEGFSVATWVHPSWPLIDDATWISSAYYVEEAVCDSWRWFHEEFVLPDNIYYISGTLMLATSDNAEEVYFNGALIGSDGEVQVPFIDDHEWGTIVEYPLLAEPGSNSLDFIVRNYAQTGGTPTSNPTGLIFKACFEYYIEETAWGDGITFNEKNWATYFTYTLQDPYKYWDLPEDLWFRIYVYPGTSNNYFDLQLWGIDPGYDIFDGVWTGWCADSGVYIYLGTNYYANVYSSYDPNLPSWASDDEQWDYINYILNHKDPSASMDDISSDLVFC
jgi:hypothetical protein